MTANQRRWLHYFLVIAAIICSTTSLFALFELGARSWTSSLNILAVILILLAVKTRGHGSGNNDG